MFLSQSLEKDTYAAFTAINAYEQNEQHAYNTLAVLFLVSYFHCINFHIFIFHHEIGGTKINPCTFHISHSYFERYQQKKKKSPKNLKLREPGI